MYIIIQQTHYEKSDWSRAFNQFTIACELDMINAISAADIAFINLVPRAFSSTIFKMADLLPSIRHFENRRGEGPGDEVVHLSCQGQLLPGY